VPEFVPVEAEEIEMAKRVVVVKNISADELEREKAIFAELHATDVKVTENDDGTFDLEGSFAD
jgi:hypothetical protein